MFSVQDVDTLRLLLVEDNPGDAEMISLLLGAGRGDVELVRTERLCEAETALASSEFDAILFDLNLPDARGLDAVERVTQAARGIPVVVLTGHDDEVATRCLEVGAEDFISKSHLDHTTVLRAISHAVSRAKNKSLALRLEQSQRLAAIGQLAAGIAHEVNNPAAFMMLNLEMVGREVDAIREVLVDGGSLDAQKTLVRLDQMDRLLTEILEGVGRISGVTKELRVLSRGQPVQPAPINLAASCNTAVRLCHHDLRQIAHFEMDLHPVTVETDGPSIVQVVANLLTNAAEATNGLADARVRLSLNSEGAWARIVVEDSGPGIPKSHRDNVLHPFFSTKSPARHAGLGLSVCAELLDRLGGRLELDAGSEGGARATVMLPANSANEVPQPTVAKEATR